nr:immunoglobulin light chain junction region [Macaca mulatta]
CQQYDNDPYSF